MFERVLQGIESREIDANIQFVFCNREEGEGEREVRRVVKVQLTEVVPATSSLLCGSVTRHHGAVRHLPRHHYCVGQCHVA